MDITPKFSFLHRVEYQDLPEDPRVMNYGESRTQMIIWCWKNLPLSDWSHDPLGIDFKHQEGLMWFLVTWS
jgi:hypothetical protein